MSDTFAVFVGEGKRKYVLHTGIATRSSGFFRAAMEREWKESRDKQITLAETNEDIFEGYLQWLNTGDITFSGPPSMLTMTSFYILGDFLDDPAFRSAALDCIVARACESNKFPTSTIIRLAWEDTVRGSPIRKLYLEIWNTHRLATQLLWLTHLPSDYPREFIVELYEHCMTSRELDRQISRDERVRMIRECRRKIAEQQSDRAGH